MSLREPVLHPTPILSLRPTQITVGMKEVFRKRDAWKKRTEQDLAKFLGAHMVPVITGLEGEHYLIDHHHLARALYEEGVESVFVTVVADLSRLPADHFWNMMDFHGWTHPYDGKGRRRPYSDLPKTVKTTEDDPYRSLAGELRNLGGFAKDFDALFGIFVGRLPAPKNQGQGDHGGFFCRPGGGADLGQDRRCRLPPRLVRPARLRPGRGDEREGEGEQGQAGEGLQGRQSAGPLKSVVMDEDHLLAAARTVALNLAPARPGAGLVLVEREGASLPDAPGAARSPSSPARPAGSAKKSRKSS